MLHVIWEFRVRPDSIAAFERHYSANGTWAQLFREDSAYKQTILLRDQEHPGRYLTTDIWNDKVAYEAFKDRNAQRYAELDKDFGELTEHESCLGHFEVTE